LIVIILTVETVEDLLSAHLVSGISGFRRLLLV
jgi:hypothetical protein